MIQFNIVATVGTAELLSENGVFSQSIFKVGEGRPNVVDAIKNGEVQKTKNKTTVMDTKTNRVSGAFVTHEPYDRTATKGRDEDDKMQEVNIVYGIRK